MVGVNASSRTVKNSFPVTGTVRPEYDRAGADAVVRSLRHR